MTKKEQRRFVADLCTAIARHINGYEFPADWDGHELRILIAQEAAREAEPGFGRIGRLAHTRRVRRVNVTVLTRRPV